MPNWGIQLQSNCSIHWFVPALPKPKSRTAIRASTRTKSMETAESEIQRHSRGFERAASAGEKTAGEEDDNQPEKDHRNSTTAIKTIDPAAIPAAYQRSFPVSVRLRTLQVISVMPATPA